MIHSETIFIEETGINMEHIVCDDMKYKTLMLLMEHIEKNIDTFHSDPLPEMERITKNTSLDERGTL